MNYASQELGLTPATKKLLQNKSVPMWDKIPEKRVVRLNAKKVYCKSNADGLVKETG